MQRSAGPFAPIGDPDIGRVPSCAAVSHPILDRRTFSLAEDGPTTSKAGAPTRPAPNSIHRIAIKGDMQ